MSMTAKLLHTTLCFTGHDPTAPKEMGGMASTSAVVVKMETAGVESEGWRVGKSKTLW